MQTLDSRNGSVEVTWPSSTHEFSSVTSLRRAGRSGVVDSVRSAPSDAPLPLWSDEFTAASLPLSGMTTRSLHDGSLLIDAWWLCSDEFRTASALSLCRMTPGSLDNCPVLRASLLVSGRTSASRSNGPVFFVVPRLLFDKFRQTSSSNSGTAPMYLFLGDNLIYETTAGSLHDCPLPRHVVSASPPVSGTTRTSLNDCPVLVDGPVPRGVPQSTEIDVDGMGSRRCERLRVRLNGSTLDVIDCSTVTSPSEVAMVVRYCVTESTAINTWVNDQISKSYRKQLWEITSNVKLY